MPSDLDARWMIFQDIKHTTLDALSRETYYETMSTGEGFRSRTLPEQSDAAHSETRSTKRRKTSPTAQVSMEVSGLVQPRSLYKSLELKPLRLTFSQQQAHAELQKFWQSQGHSDQEDTIWQLDNFSVYRPDDGSRHEGEFVPLHRLMVDRGPQELLLDGVLCVGNKRRYVEGLAFSEVTVEGYGDRYVTSLEGKMCSII